MNRNFVLARCTPRTNAARLGARVDLSNRGSSRRTALLSRCHTSLYAVDGGVDPLGGVGRVVEPGVATSTARPGAIGSTTRNVRSVTPERMIVAASPAGANGCLAPPERSRRFRGDRRGGDSVQLRQKLWRQRHLSHLMCLAARTPSVNSKSARVRIL